MNYYRLYRLWEGHFVGFEDFEAASDAEAVRVAAAQRGSAELELWCENRRLKSFEAERKDA